MNHGLAKQAGSALVWKAVQQGGVNLIYLCRLLILARLLGPEDFGLLAIAMTGITFLMSITNFGMIPALVQRTEATDQHYNAAWTVGILRGLTICGAVFFTAPVIAVIFREPRAVDILRGLAVYPLLEAAASIRVAELIRKLRFRSLGIAKLSEALANSILSVALARHFGVWALVVGTLAGPTAYVVLSYIVAPHRPRLILDRKAIGPLMRYGKWFFVTGLITLSGGVALRVLISRQLGAAALGLYFLASKLAFLPNEVASEVVGGVTFPLYARFQANIREATRVFRAVFTSTLLVLTPGFLLMLVLAPSLVRNVLGPRWEGTEPLIRLLAVVGLIGLAGDAAVPVLKGLGQPYKYAVLEGGQSLLLVIFAWAFIAPFGLVGAAYAWFAAIAGTVIASVVFLRQSLQFPFRGTGKPLAAIGSASLSAALIAVYVQRIVPDRLGLSLAVLSGAVVTSSILWILNRAFELKLTKDLARAFPQAAPLLANFD